MACHGIRRTSTGKKSKQKKQIKNLEPQERRIRWEKDGGIHIIGHILPLSVFSVGETQQEYTNISHPLWYQREATSFSEPQIPYIQWYSKKFVENGIKDKSVWVKKYFKLIHSFFQNIHFSKLYEDPPPTVCMDFITFCAKINLHFLVHSP